MTLGAILDKTGRLLRYTSIRSGVKDPARAVTLDWIDTLPSGILRAWW
ncbi:MAG: hypothetical protein IIB73_04990 [Proteobacteria bacterium]|nr:hypothetical protein [Pseudomonadota bacterium]